MLNLSVWFPKKSGSSLFVIVFALSSLFLFTSISNAAQDVVFDECHAQTAGNADWTATGGFSDFADTFKEFGLNVVSAKKEINADILKNAVILVLSEPNSVFSASEKKVIEDFVARGGSLFAIADHKGADRNNDGIDALSVLNQILPKFGLTYDVNSINEFPIPIQANSDPILEGSKTMGTWAGTTVTATAAYAKAVVASQKQKGKFLFGYSTPANYKGKVIAFGDSSIFDDGTGAPGNKLYDGYNRKDCSHIILTRNCIKFLLGQKSEDKNLNAIATANSIASTINGEVSKHYDPSHPGHLHQAPDGTMYHQTGDFYPGSLASYPNGYPSTQPVPQQPQYPNYPPQPQYSEDTVLYQQGFKYFNENNFLAAIKFFQKLTSKYKNSQYYEGSLYYTALCHKNTYNYNGALKVLRTMINELRNSPNRVNWFFTCAEVCESAGQFVNSGKWLESFLNEYSNNPKAAEALYRAGQAYEKGCSYKDAVRAYRRLVASFAYSPYAQMSYERITALAAYGY